MFTWTIQLAGYDFDRYDHKGNTDYQNFVSEFESFPWIEQIELRKRLSKGCSPTLSVEDHKSIKDLWVSMAGDKSNHGYLMGYVYPKVVRGILGLGSPKEINWLKIYFTEDKDVVKRCFKMFFDREFELLEETIEKLELFDEMKARNK